ncbi:MAG: hypothetical protein KF712_19485 [Akkermansiaceae bacterium]|nr:hypothetical protein [Akkermansiaceae bacterium]
MNSAVPAGQTEGRDVTRAVASWLRHDGWANGHHRANFRSRSISFVGRNAELSGKSKPPGVTEHPPYRRGAATPLP